MIMARGKTAPRLHGAFTVCFSILVIVLLLGAPLHALAGELTVTTRLTIEDLRSQTEHWLGQMVADLADDESLVVGLRWVQDTSGWFPTWVLQLVSDTGMLAPGKAKTSHDGLATVELAKVAPAAGHTYEATLSYSGEVGAVAIRLLDLTADRAVYVDGLEVDRYDGDLHAPGGSVTPYFVPVGVSWAPGTMQATFLPLTQFTTRGEEATIRLVSPTPTQGEFRFYIVTAESEKLLAAVAPEQRETWIPLPLSTMPLGQSELRMDYIVDGAVVRSETKAISLGRVDFMVRPVVVEREDGIATVAVSVTSPETVDEELAVELRATVSELVWNAETRNFDYVVYREDVPVYEGTLDLAEAEAELVGTIPLPDRPGNWRIELQSDVAPRVATTVRGGERLFSTHLPADVQPGETYSIVVLPDTQHYAQAYPEIYIRMTDWITANAASMNLAAVLHVGDITNNNTPAQWENAFAAMSLLNDVAPYVISIGNHDMVGPNGVDRRGDTLVNNYFSVEHARRYGNLAGTLVPDRIENHYALLTIGDTDYLVISLEFAPPDEAVEWARQVAEQYPNHEVILLTHSYLSGNGRRSSNMLNSLLAQNPDTTVNTAASMWNNIMYPIPNSMMVVGGHSAPKAVTVPYQVHGNVAAKRVYEFVFDWQDEANGGNGWLGLITVRPDDALDISVFSPYLDEWADTRDGNGFRSRYTVYR